MIETVGARMHRKQPILTLAPGANQFAKLAARAYAAGPGETKRDRVRAQALRRARPLARRALRTFRPPLVAMRARNPCTRLRFSSLGWKVLFMLDLSGNSVKWKGRGSYCRSSNLSMKSSHSRVRRETCG